jgi:hypothetical protein
MRHYFAVSPILYLAIGSAVAAECTATSTPYRVPLLELYTSEGCDSCPPADRWVSSLPSRGLGGDRLVVLAFHVDYWDRLGWPDRFAQARFTERQRAVNERNRSRVVYTPHLVLNGKDYRRGLGDDVTERVAAISQERAKVALSLNVAPSESQWRINAQWSGAKLGDARAWVALYENNLATDIRAGENRNKRLQHDFVVRDLAGPFPSGGFSHVFKVDAAWKRRDLAVAAFIQEPRSGDVLQALMVASCSQ